MSWRLHDYKRKQKLREQEEKRRQRLAREESEPDSTLGIQHAICQPSESASTGSGLSSPAGSFQATQLTATPASSKQSSPKRSTQESPGNFSTLSTPSQAKRVMFRKQSSTKKPIDPRWLDPPIKGKEEKAESQSKKSWQLSFDDDSPLGKKSTEKFGKPAKKAKPIVSSVPKKTVPPVPVDSDDDDSFGDELFAEFRQHLQSKKRPHGDSKIPARKTDSACMPKPNEDSSVSQRDSIESFSQSQGFRNDSIHSSSDTKPPRRSFESVDKTYSSSTLQKQVEPAPQVVAKVTKGNCGDSLWSDSEAEDEAPPPKRGRKDKSPGNKAIRGHPSHIPGIPSMGLSGTNMGMPFSDMNTKELGSTLHPTLQSPKFGPYDLEPIHLQNGSQEHQVPASLSRYLAPFQVEGVKFMYNCLTRGTGSILGDDMGCGKTVQVLALLLALFRKRGTGLDVMQLARRRKIIDKWLEEERLVQEEALRKGQPAIQSSAKHHSELCESLELPEHWWPILIIVPPTLIENWKNEIARFTHFTLALYTGKDRDAALTQLVKGSAEVLLTTKALFQQAGTFQELNSIPHKWRLVIIDEFHTWKSVDSMAATNLRMLKSKHTNLVLGMTGTLMSNNHKELWNLIDMVETNFIGEWDEFRVEVADAIKLGRTKTASRELIRISNEKAKALRERLKAIFIERTKEEVLKEYLPKKLEKLVLCELSALQKQVYQHILTLPDYELVKTAHSPCDCGVNLAFFQRVQRLKTPAERVSYYRENKNSVIPKHQCCYKIPRNPRYEEGGTEPLIDPDASLWRMLKAHQDDQECKMCPFCCGLPALTKVYKLADHLALLQVVRTPGCQEEGSPEHIEMMKELEFAKVALLPEIVEQLPGKSHFRKDGIMDNHFDLSGKLKVLHRLLKNFSNDGSRVLLFSYSTQTLDLIQNYLRASGHSYLRMDGGTPTHLRQSLADQFNSDQSIFVFLLSTKAMGTGLNLTSANKVIIFNSEWNPSNDEQAQDRAYRIGQARDVEVLRLVAQGTIDELRYLRQLYKVQLKQETLVDDTVALPKAARMFRGVEGDKSRKGELFGYENLLRFKDGKFLDDIWKQTGRGKPPVKQGDVEMHVASQLSDQILEQGTANMDAVLDDTVAREIQAITDSGTGSGSNGWIETKEVVDSISEQMDAQALDHRDLFRGDKGRPAIMEGEDGFDEEMGGATQNIFQVYEAGVELPDNPQEGSEDGESNASISSQQAVHEGEHPVSTPPAVTAHSRLQRGRDTHASRALSMTRAIEPEWVVDFKAESPEMEGTVPAGLGGMPEAGATAADASSDPSKLIDLSGSIDKPHCYARNADSRFPMTNLFIGDSRLGCKSDADEQIIIHIAFHEFVNVKSIKFTAFNDGQDPECNPTTIKVFVNRNNLGFEDVEDVDPTQIFSLTAEDLRESSEPLQTKYVKFQRVTSLTFFVEENDGGEITALGSLKLMGGTVFTTNMRELKKNPNQS
eukprot:Nitzschia sp. Nitz4//scaffold38_size140716//41140//46477//NITZ4_003135-RA/size140716-augustus-gene-0.121-mRNA-1//1//CDS//3329550042//67//frame0